jgi:Ca2+-binding RTX toxin-like protein
MRGGADNDCIMDKAGTDKLLGQGGRDRLKGGGKDTVY